MERLNFETLFRIVRWDYNRCFKDESLDKDLFMEKYGKVMGEHYYNKFVHEFNGNILKMIGYFRGSEKEGQVFCDMITECIEKYEQRGLYSNGTYMKIEYIQKCKCGAVTIRFDNSASNSMFWETFEKLDLDTGDATWLHQSYCCDHCINHWGIGLCGCGSGQKVGKCECGSQKAHDILGVKYDSFGVILKNFG